MVKYLSNLGNYFKWGILILESLDFSKRSKGEYFSHPAVYGLFKNKRLSIHPKVNKKLCSNNYSFCIKLISHEKYRPAKKQRE